MSREGRRRRAELGGATSRLSTLLPGLGTS